MQLIPHEYTPPSVQQQGGLGTIQSVYLMIDASAYEGFLAKIEEWFAGRDEVTLVDHGTSDKLGAGCVILEWSNGTEVDPMFLVLLQEMSAVTDYTVFSREVLP